MTYKDDMTRDEILSKLNLFKDTKTYTFLKIRYSGGFRIYNCYVLKIKDSYVMVQDRKLGNFPIEINDIIRVDVSKEREREIK